MQIQVRLFPIKGKKGYFLSSFIHPISEKPIRKRFTSKERALKYKIQVEKKFRGNDLSLIPDMNVGDYLLHFLKKSPKNPLTQKKKLLRDFGETFSEFEIEDLTHDFIETWLRQLKEENNYTKKTMVALKVALNSFFKFLLKEGVISKTPITGLSAYKIKIKRNILSENQIDHLLKELRRMSPGHLYPIVFLVYETLAQTHEVLELKWNDVNLEKKIVRFRDSNRLQPRVLKISTHMKNLIDQKKRYSRFVFTCPYQKPMNKNKLRRAILEFNAKVGLPFDWGLMDIRHSLSQHFLRKGGHPRDLQKRLGFKKVNEVRQRYPEFYQL